MNPEIKAKWLAALRSGEYEQTRETLRNSKGFCCLGVLTDLYIKEKETKWIPEKRYDETVFYWFEGELETLPDCVKHWAGLDEWNPLVTHKGGRTCLGRLNDIERLDFNQIADVIEEQF